MLLQIIIKNQINIFHFIPHLGYRKLFLNTSLTGFSKYWKTLKTNLKNIVVIIFTERGKTVSLFPGAVIILFVKENARF